MKQLLHEKLVLLFEVDKFTSQIMAAIDSLGLTAEKEKINKISALLTSRDDVLKKLERLEKRLETAQESKYDCPQLRADICEIIFHIKKNDAYNQKRLKAEIDNVMDQMQMNNRGRKSIKAYNTDFSSFCGRLDTMG